MTQKENTKEREVSKNKKAAIALGLMGTVCMFVYLFDLSFDISLLLGVPLIVAVIIYEDIKTYRKDQKIWSLLYTFGVSVFLLTFYFSDSLKGYIKYSEVYSSKRPACEAGDAKACQDIGYIQYRNGSRRSARSHYFVACQLGNESACEEFNDNFIKSSDLRLSLVLYTANCTKGDKAACGMKARLLKEIADEEEDPVSLEKSCDLGNGSACYDIGKSYVDNNIIEAEKYYRKACKHDSGLCWALQYSCQSLNDIAPNDKDIQSLNESLKICDSLCKNDKVGCDYPEAFYKRQAEAFDKTGEILKAYEYSHLACGLRKADGACLITKYACGNFSFSKFSKRSPTQGEIDETLKLCDKDCSSGNSNACGGLGNYHQNLQNWREAFLYYKKECDLNLIHCSLIQQCKTRLSKFLEKAKNQTEKDEFTEICNSFEGKGQAIK